MRQFSNAHLAALAVLVVASGVSIWAPRRHPGAWVVAYARALGLLILAGWLGEYVADAINGTWMVKYTLPLQLTDAVSLAAIVALWTRNRLAVELTYFWGLTASLQAALTPDLGQSFPSIYYFTYFTYHIGAITAACLLVFGCGIYPRPRAFWRVFGITLAYAAVVGLADVVTGGNYMYLRAKPVHNSLLNVMGPWPWYIASTALLGLGMLVLLQALAGLVQRTDSRTGTRLSDTGPTVARAQRYPSSVG
jgi:hypothetical integral membrane protein (TIGR02206 family)